MDEAMDKLARESPEKAELVRLRFYTGCNLSEAAMALGVSTATAKRYWTYARAWLYSELSGE
jgi:DNA-directed RNA polymerase specialized sigma24 family protein